MPEREKPRTPGKDELRLELESERVTLASYQQMSDRLHEIVETDDPNFLEQTFYPFLLLHADQTMTAEQAVRIVVDTLRNCLPEKNIRAFLVKNGAHILHAMFADSRVAERATQFLLTAVNG